MSSNETATVADEANVDANSSNSSGGEGGGGGRGVHTTEMVFG